MKIEGKEFLLSPLKLTGNNIHISNTRGADPASGIDIEPNNKNNILQDINFKNYIQLTTLDRALLFRLKAIQTPLTL